MLHVVALYDGMLDGHHGFVDLGSVEPGDLLESRRGQRNGLCGAQAPQTSSMVTGLHAGQVPFRIEWFADPPPHDETWQEVVEVSVSYCDAQLTLGTFEPVDIALPATGWHRGRYSARRMQEGSDLDTPDEDEMAPDECLLQLWPAPCGDDLVIREHAAIATFWHGVAQGGHP